MQNIWKQLIIKRIHFIEVYILVMFKNLGIDVGKTQMHLKKKYLNIDLLEMLFFLKFMKIMIKVKLKNENKLSVE